MFARKIAKPQAKATVDLANGSPHQRSTLAAHRLGLGSAGEVRLARCAAGRRTAWDEHGDHHEYQAGRGAQQGPPGTGWDFSEIPVFGPNETGRPQATAPLIAPLWHSAIAPERAHAEKYYLAAGQADDQAKVERDTVGRSENGVVGALIGGGAGASIGAVIGGLVGGPVGALVGGVAGALIGGTIGALIGSAGTAISWKRARYVADGADDSSTTVNEPFNVTYKAQRDTSKSVWRMRVSRIEGGVDINVHTGGSRDPVAAPPDSQDKARDAVTVMKGYYARGSRGAWHTEAASRRHEEHHEREWKGSAEHYWPVARNAIEAMTVPLASHGDEASAVTAMRAGAGGADAKIAELSTVARAYWFTLADDAASRPYAAGQLRLNDAIRNVQRLAAGKHWVVPQGTDSPDPEPPCYQPWLPFAP